MVSVARLSLGFRILAEGIYYGTKALIVYSGSSVNSFLVNEPLSFLNVNFRRLLKC
jgi:hypothetical protein